MIQPDAAYSLFPPWGTFTYEKKSPKTSTSSNHSNQSRRGLKRKASDSFQSISLSMKDGPELYRSSKNDGSNTAKGVFSRRVREKASKMVRIKQEKDSDDEDVKVMSLSTEIASGSVEERENPLVSRIPVGGQEFIASVLTTSLEDRTCPSLNSVKGKISVSNDHTEDKIVQLSDDHTYFEFTSPRKKIILKITKNPEKPIDRVKSLEELINILTRENLLNAEARRMLEAFMELPEGLVKNRSQNPHLSRPHMKFNRIIQTFASTLYFYAPQAYEYTSNLFILPKPESLLAGIRVRNYFPGFTKEALKILKTGFYNVSSPENMCSVMLVDMNIRECNDLDNTQEEIVGLVDFGVGRRCEDEYDVPVATNALLFIAVGLTSPWKIPFGYFLHSGLSGELLKTLVLEAIVVLEENNLQVRTLVCEVQSPFLHMGKILGCKVNVKTYKDLETGFQHPLVTDRRIHLIFSVNHGLKMLQKLLIDKECLQSTTYGKIEWRYLKLLMEPTSRYLPSHSVFHRHKIKISLGCHSLGSSLGKVLELCSNEEQDKFAGCETTGDFAADIDRAFDTLNSSNTVVPGERSPIFQYTVEEQRESLTFVARRVLALETTSGKRIIDEGRRMSVIALAFTLKGVAQLASELVNRNIVRYLCTYRLNLDHAEVVLSYLQRIGGWTDEPTASELQSSYRKLLMNINAIFQINSVYNIDLEGDSIAVGQGLINPFRSSFSKQDLHLEDFITCKSPLVDLGAELTYRAKIVIYHVVKKLSCSSCIEILLDDDYGSIFFSANTSKFILCPSQYVEKLIFVSEKCLRLKLLRTHQFEIEEVVLEAFIEYSTHASFLGIKESSLEHFAEEPPHVVSLTKIVIRTFLSLRLKNYCKVLKRII